MSSEPLCVAEYAIAQQRNTNMTTPLVIYHANCPDGFGAAWAAWRYFNRDAELVPASYGKPPPDVAGREVYVVDFSYPATQLIDMATEGHAANVTVLDHHITAYENISKHFGFDWEGTQNPQSADYVDATMPLHYVFDLNHSGAVMTWQYLFGAQLPPPELLLHIEDRDLWKFELPNTRTILAALGSYDQDINVWDELMAANLEELLHDGKAIERKYQKDVKNITETTRRMGQIGGYNVPVANCPGQYASDVGALLAVGHSFAATYYDTDSGRKFSLRSLKDGGLDVAAIAQKFGGGGHKNAAGFSVERDSELGMM
jgi:uncharacterized protein